MVLTLYIQHFKSETCTFNAPSQKGMGAAPFWVVGIPRLFRKNDHPLRKWRSRSIALIASIFTWTITIRCTRSYTAAFATSRTRSFTGRTTCNTKPRFNSARITFKSYFTFVSAHFYFSPLPEITVTVQTSTLTATATIGLTWAYTSGSARTFARTPAGWHYAIIFTRFALVSIHTFHLLLFYSYILSARYVLWYKSLTITK